MRKRFRKGDELERELRRQRPEPSKELVAMLSERVREERRPRLGGFRLAFAGTLTAVALAALGLVGGLGYAANAVQSAARTAAHVVAPVKHTGPKTVRVISAAAKQYKVQFCKHYGDRKHKAKTITISPDAIPAQLAHSDPGSHVGPCTPADFNP